MVFRRFWSTALLALGAVLGATPALAQPTAPVAQALAASDFTIKLQRSDGDGGWEYLSSIDEGYFFNQARCQCTDDDESAVNIVVQMESAGRTKLTQILAQTNSNAAYARLYVGNGCAATNSADNTKPNCPDGLLATTNTLAPFSSTGSWAVKTTVAQLFAGTKCNGTGQTYVWLWLSTTGDPYPDSGITGSSAPNKIIKLDGAPPPAPGNIVVDGGNEALMVSWGASSTTDNPIIDLAGYLVFCSRGEENLQVFSPSYYKSGQYQTGAILCESTTPPIGVSSTGSLKGATTAIEVKAPEPFKMLNQNYTCSELISTTDTSARIRVLQNEIYYNVGVAAVDLSGNISPITSAFAQKPIPTMDFYRDYRDAGGDAPGGYCSFSGWTGRPGILACLAAAGLLGLFLIRRRRGSGTRGLTVLLVLLAAGSAQAQPPAVSHDEEAHADLNATFEEPHSYRSSKNFAFELRFGAFRPDVDSEFSDAGIHPYKDVYGGKRHLMFQFEFDWQLFQAFGSLALGAQVGYYSQSAKAFESNPDGTIRTDPKTDEPIRSGDSTSLRLIPLAALAVYRFDVMALRWGIPLVPYGKLGLNYTFWRITDGNGSIPSYAGGHGSGATLGWQAAAGISLMLDFIDPTAARNLDQETSVNHTHLFFEWNKVAANGLGQSKKLHVGDSSWVVGLMFEF